MTTEQILKKIREGVDSVYDRRSPLDENAKAYNAGLDEALYIIDSELKELCGPCEHCGGQDGHSDVQFINQDTVAYRRCPEDLPVIE